MTRTLHSFQEEGWRVDSCETAVVTAHPEVRIVVERPSGLSSFKVMMYINVGDKTIGIAENEYESVEALMDDLGIDDVDEVWEFLGQ